MSIFYKKFLIFFFKILFSRIKIPKKKFSEKFFYKSLIINKLKIKIYKIKECRLFTNTLDVAVIKNNFLLSGPSLQIRNNKNVDIKKNSVYHNGTPKFYKKIPNRVFSLLPGMDANANYYHWFFDSLSKLYFYERFFKLKKSDFFLVPNNKYEYQKKSLRLMGIKKVLNAYNIKHFKIKELITTNFTNFGENPPLEVINFLKKKIMKKINLNKMSNNYIFLNRTGLSSLYRDIYNKKEIINFLNKKGFKIIDPSKLNLLSQIKLFNSARKIIGIHGAAFTNIIFCKKKTKIIELKAINSKNNTITNIAIKLNLNFTSLFLKKNTNHKSKSWNGLLYLNKKKLSKILI